ncbi:MAG: zinc carboxypeptidase [Proteobacteria bacterium]|nr:zinc carboxypeptidase [Pseudomonadota bacterium]
MKSFPELINLQKVIDRAPSFARFKVLREIEFEGSSFPIISMEMGSEDKSVPCFGLFGGVHGLERIGSQLIINYLDVLFEQLKWDEDLAAQFSKCRIVSIPIINPVGMSKGWRSNVNGVDLMRNAPGEFEKKVSFLVGGHRIGRWLPWYRGPQSSQMEVEAQVLVDFVKEQLFPSRFSMALDVHSGFGLKDQIWYPFARSEEAFPRMDLVEKFRNLLDKSHPNHIYVLEAQSKNYTTNGDLWDYIFDQFTNSFGHGDKVFLPWTLEIGSWIWIRKNPLQMFSSMGLFNPIKEHRFRRTMRRHRHLIDLFYLATKNYQSWLKQY